MNKLKPCPRKLENNTMEIVSKKGNIIAKVTGFDVKTSMQMQEEAREKTIRLVDKARMLQAKREALLIQLQTVDEMEAAKQVARQLRAENKLIREGIREVREKYKKQRDNSVVSQVGVDPYKEWQARPYIQTLTPLYKETSPVEE